MRIVTTLFIISLMFSLCAQSTFEQSLSINSTGADPCTDCVIDIQSNSKVMQVPNLNTTERNNLGNPIPGMMIYNSDSLSLQGYLPEATLVEPIQTFPYANGSSNVFAFTVIVYTPSISGYIESVDVGIGSANITPQHRLVVSSTKPCGGGSAIAKPETKSNSSTFTDYITLSPNSTNRYPLSSPFQIIAGTKYYIYPDAMTNGAGPRILWSDTGVQNIPTISYINTAGFCNENFGDVNAKFNIITNMAEWVNLTD